MVGGTFFCCRLDGALESFCVCVRWARDCVGDDSSRKWAEERRQLPLPVPSSSYSSFSITFAVAAVFSVAFSRSDDDEKKVEVKCFFLVGVSSRGRILVAQKK